MCQWGSPGLRAVWRSAAPQPQVSSCTFQRQNPRAPLEVGGGAGLQAEVSQGPGDSERQEDAEALGPSPSRIKFGFCCQPTPLCLFLDFFPRRYAVSLGGIRAGQHVPGKSKQKLSFQAVLTES